jgi:hypothetical protein
MSNRIRKNRNKEILDMYILRGCPKKTDRKRVACLDPKKLIRAWMGRKVEYLKFTLAI